MSDASIDYENERIACGEFDDDPPYHEYSHQNESSAIKKHNVDITSEIKELENRIIELGNNSDDLFVNYMESNADEYNISKNGYFEYIVKKQQKET